MKKLEATAQRQAKASMTNMTAIFRLQTDGHFLPIGMAACALLQNNEPVTVETLLRELRAQPTDMAPKAFKLWSGAIGHLEQLFRDDIKI